MNPISEKVNPRIMPRDTGDCLTILFIGVPLQIVPLLVLPSILVFFAVNALGVGIENSIICAFAAFLFIYSFLITFTVWSLRLSEDGIKFVRLWGRPKLLHWNEITDISEAPRKEVIIRGWLWPLFPAREMTPCLSALRHFRIRWGSDYRYFPPADPDAFLQLIDEFRKK